MVLCLVPTGVFAESKTVGSAAIRYGTDAIHGYDATDGYSYIYYGVHNGDPVKCACRTPRPIQAKQARCFC